jgi:transposase
MTLADQAAIAGKDGQMSSSRPKRRAFSAAYKERVLAGYEQAGPGERGALLRREGLLTSHISGWRKTRDKGAREALTARKTGRPAQPAAGPAEIGKLKKENEKLTAELARTKAALEVVGKAHALLELLSESADSDAKRQE